MKSLLACLAALALGSQLVAEEPKAQVPLSPTFVQVESVGKDQNGAGDKLLSCVYVEARVTYVPDTKKKGAYTEVVTKNLLKGTVPLNRLVVTTAAGKPVDGGPGWEKLVGRTAVLQTGGVPLDPRSRQDAGPGHDCPHRRSGTQEVSWALATAP